jgi:hypothetical protein
LMVSIVSMFSPRLMGRSYSSKGCANNRGKEFYVAILDP